MEASPRHNLKIIDGATGEVLPACPGCRELEAHEKRLEAEVKGWRLRYAKLEADKDADALAAPERPLVELLHACWKAATGRRRPLSTTDREQMGAGVRKLGLLVCLKAIAGAAYDPHYSRPQRNGKRERYDDLDLIFRNFSKTLAFADRAPLEWTPKPDRIAALAGVSEEWVTEKLAEKQPRRKQK